LEAEYCTLLLGTAGIVPLPLDAVIARGAAELRARYALRTPDAVQVATAISVGCQAFLTNDRGLQRVNELRVLVLDDLTLWTPDDCAPFCARAFGCMALASLNRRALSGWCPLRPEVAQVDSPR
jgi:hypothetical protein